MGKNYTAKDITVLEGLDPVRKRPAMYIGGTGKDGLHHLISEIVDNSVDEAMNGHGSSISVTLSADRRTLSVTDDGRGIPVDLHPKAKIPAVTVILTTLHAGGKFSNKSYARAGGLHGVGASVVNALSEHLEVEIYRDGFTYTQSFVRGKPTGKLKKSNKNKNKTDKTGTKITFTPDPEIFGKRARFDSARVYEDLDNRSFVHKGVRFFFTDEGTGETKKFLQNRGIAALLERQLKLQGVPLSVPEPFELDYEYEEGEAGGKLEVVLIWTEATDERIRSYVNGVVTPAHGTHVTGFRAAVAKAIRSYMESHKKSFAKGLKVTNEDMREGMMAVVSFFLAEPQFQGQTKAKLNNPDAAAGVEGALRPALEQWFNAKPSIADMVVARVELAARARQAKRTAAKAVRQKGRRSRRDMPDKLAQCSSRTPEKCELFIVEGDSAGGSAKQGRNSVTQAVLPLRGKVLNAEQAPLKRVLENRELSDVIRALGCGIGQECDVEKLNYGKVILLMDADPDGDHITILLLTFFYRHMRNLILAGKLYLARPPLYRIQLGKETYWAANDAERDALLQKHRKNRKPTISRFKGLGEMEARTLADTTMKPGKRDLRQVTMDDHWEADRTIRELMGRDAEHRFALIDQSTGGLSIDDVDI
ncbi:MAG: type IIA DNA topoisomerase subunit B [Planctomycetes bacterium]|nr:type IIA DNA topoisomerase subunit B [Planctomycetota bacterium]